MKPRSFWTDLKCSICGKEGSWPFIPYLNSGELVSERPSDVAAVLVLGDLKGDYDLHPYTLEHLEIEHDIFCPNCYRIGMTPEANSVGRDCFGEMTLDRMNGVLNGVYPVTVISRDDMLTAFRGAHKFVPQGDEFCISAERLSRQLAYVFFPAKEIKGAPIGIHICFYFEQEWKQFSPDVAPRFWVETSLGPESNKNLPACSMWTADLSDEDRAYALTLIFDFYASVANRMQHVRKKATSMLRRAAETNRSSGDVRYGKTLNDIINENYSPLAQYADGSKV